MSPEDHVLDRLQREAARHRREAYSGDLLADIRPRLGGRDRSRARWPLAAAALVACVLAAHLAFRAPAPAPAARVRSLSPFQTVPRATALSVPPPRTLSPTPAQLGRALRSGAEALSALRPPSRAWAVEFVPLVKPVPEEESK
jgi:hypothetical protein